MPVCDASGSVPTQSPDPNPRLSPAPPPPANREASVVPARVTTSDSASGVTDKRGSPQHAMHSTLPSESAACGPTGGSADTGMYSTTYSICTAQWAAASQSANKTTSNAHRGAVGARDPAVHIDVVFGGSTAARKPRSDQQDNGDTPLTVIDCDAARHERLRKKAARLLSSQGGKTVREQRSSATKAVTSF